MGRLNALSNLLHCSADFTQPHVYAKCGTCGDTLELFNRSLGKPFTVTWPDGSVHKSSGIAGQTFQSCRCGTRRMVAQSPLAVTPSRRKGAMEALNRAKLTIPCPYCQQDFSTWAKRPAKACKKCRCKAPYLRDHRPEALPAVRLKSFSTFTCGQTEDA